MAIQSSRSGALQLVSFAICPYVHRATIMLREKGVDHEITYIDLADKPDWFLAISPRGKVPVLVTDGTPLFESTAILEYLDETRPPRLLPEDPIERARQRAWVVVTDDLVMGQYRVSIAQTQAEIDSAVEGVRRVLALFDDAVRLPLFAGESFGMVDAAGGPALHRLLFLEEHTPVRFFEGLGKARQWAENIVSRPSVRDGVRATFADEFIAYAAARQSALLRPLVR
jgi:glutathione S-transferase